MNQNEKHIKIIADDRERKSNVIKSLLDMKNISVDVRRLSIGDYLADNRLIFERKTLNDFAVSIIDGRLFKQAVRLAGSNYKSVLILEGVGKDLHNIGIRREALQGALISISLILGIPVLRSRDPSETASLIAFATRQIKSFTRGTFQRHGYQPKNKRKKQLFILQGLPGVGIERAIRLLDTFGSIEAVIAASCGELQFIEGIGKITAEKIKWVVNEPIHPYWNSNEFSI